MSRHAGSVATLTALLIAAGGNPAHAANDITVGLDDQWYTGSLLSPSGAMPHAGMVSIEPYLIFADQTGQFDAGGHSGPVAAASRSLTSSTLFKYGLTDRFSLQLLPAFSYGWDKIDTSSGLKLEDLPVELQYRFLDADDRRLRPALTAFLGLNLPLGDFDRLRRAEDGVGTGAWSIRTGLLSQSAYLVAGKPLRLRVYANLTQPIAAVGLHGASVYDTDAGFAGQATPGFAASIGTSLEYGLTQRWVAAFDAVRDIQDGNRLRGHGPDGIRFGESEGATGDWTLAPALEYNFSGHVGFIAGAALTVAGHNTKNIVSPQIAVNFVY